VSFYVCVYIVSVRVATVILVSTVYTLRLYILLPWPSTFLWARADLHLMQLLPVKRLKNSIGKFLLGYFAQLNVQLGTTLY